MIETLEARVMREAADNRANTVKHVANLLWAWVQYHEGVNRLSPRFDETADAREWYKRNYKGHGAT